MRQTLPIQQLLVRQLLVDLFGLQKPLFEDILEFYARNQDNGECELTIVVYIESRKDHLALKQGLLQILFDLIDHVTEKQFFVIVGQTFVLNLFSLVQIDSLDRLIPLSIVRHLVSKNM